MPSILGEVETQIYIYLVLCILNYVSYYFFTPRNPIYQAVYFMGYICLVLLILNNV